MPLNLPNLGALPGFWTGMPQAIQQIAQMRNQQQQLGMQQKHQQLADALLQKKLQSPFGGQIAPGGVGQEMWLDNIGKTLGTDSPLYKRAKSYLDSQAIRNEIMNQYHQAQTLTAPARGLSPLGKLARESQMVQSGQMPGAPAPPGSMPGAQGPFSPQQQELMNQYNLARQKQTTDPAVRQKVLFATNIDKTIDQINPDHLSQYAGLAGDAEKKIQQGLTPFGKESVAFDNYQKSVRNSQLLAHQVRQFYGDSITPGVMRKLESLTNPSSWKSNPRLAKQNFNTLKNLLSKETSTYRGALRSTSPYHGAPGDKGSAASDPLGIR